VGGARPCTRGKLTFAIPAHGPAPAFTTWAGMDAARADVPTSHGLDTRDRAWKVQATAQELFAEATGAKQTLFSTNGSSLSVHVAIMTVAGPGDTILMARNGHKSSFALWEQSASSRNRRSRRALRRSRNLAVGRRSLVGVEAPASATS
jgi:arginine/lysine/ornithine decarboxylase